MLSLSPGWSLSVASYFFLLNIFHTGGCGHVPARPLSMRPSERWSPAASCFGSEILSLKIKIVTPLRRAIFFISGFKSLRSAGVGGQLRDPETTPLLRVIVAINIYKPHLQFPDHSCLQHFLSSLLFPGKWARIITHS